MPKNTGKIVHNTPAAWLKKMLSLLLKCADKLTLAATTANISLTWHVTQSTRNCRLFCNVVYDVNATVCCA
jgi:hypothetical protein